ncbi:hypothetical protein Q7V23_08290 [Streptococcus suis]|nr:hypothetical protein [Streptococcus suis]MDW8576085.1 hypothetical protein [Streptococcus suis]MDW8590015.1 hypothetical protein [Streptococcus suis]MDW8616012.1 hypothetical protein [Streptococcus suis]CYV15849.1 Uncharacterised protein [Streptococcus suis]
MFLFAFPGMGKTTLAKKYTDVVDLEMSDIKYDNSSVRHLTKEERKSTKRPLKDRRYKTIYVNKAYTLHRQGKTVLVALNFLMRMLLAMSIRDGVPFHIYIPHPSLKEEYRQRYISRGNNDRFIFEVNVHLVSCPHSALPTIEDFPEMDYSNPVGRDFGGLSLEESLY